jgi:hypothetical protein
MCYDLVNRVEQKTKNKAAMSHPQEQHTQTEEDLNPWAQQDDPEDLFYGNPFEDDEPQPTPQYQVDPTATIVHPAPEQEGARSPGEELTHGLSRVAVVHRLGEFVSPRFRHPNGNAIGVAERGDATGYADLYNIVHTGAETGDLPSYVDHSPQVLEKVKALEAVSRVVGEHAISSMKNLEAGQEDMQIDWRVAAESLLHEAKKVDAEDEKHARLVGAVMAAQFTDTKEDRIDFLRQVYDNGLEREMAEACNSSDLVVVVDTPGAKWGAGDHEHFVVHPVRHYARAFEVGDYNRLTNYLEHLPKGAVEGDGSEDLPTVKGLQTKLTNLDASDPEAEKVREQAELKAVSGEKVGGSLIDMYKIERFALQNKFLKAQFKALFGESKAELIRSPFARRLAELRSEPTAFVTANEMAGKAEEWTKATVDTRIETAMNRITDHVDRAFRDLSVPVVAEYGLDGLDLSDPSQLTEPQRAALRFREVVKQLRQHNAITQFVDYEDFTEKQNVEFVASLDDSQEIWTSSQDGAAIPLVTGDSMLAVMKGVIAAEQKGAPRARPDKILEMLQGDRRRLLGFATHNIREFSKVSNGELFEALTVERIDKVIEEHGQQVPDYDLVMRGIVNIDPKDSFEVYASITMGCPALREIHGDRKLLDVQERIAHGSSNYIDHVMAAVYNEAYARGAFNVDAYTTTFPPPPHPMN